MFRFFRFSAFDLFIPSEMKYISFSARCLSPPLRILCQLDGLLASRVHVLENTVIFAAISRAYGDDTAEQVTYHHVITGYEFHFVFHNISPKIQARTNIVFAFNLKHASATAYQICAVALLFYTDIFIRIYASEYTVKYRRSEACFAAAYLFAGINKLFFLHCCLLSEYVCNDFT